ncbi:MAG: AI-2E family transporter [Betaproteobacteria bacterium]
MASTGPPTPTAGTFYPRAFALLALAALGFLLYRILEPFFAPIAWAFFLAFLLHPVQGWLARRLGGRESLSAALLTAATVALLLGPLAALAAAFVAQAADLLRHAQDLAAEHRPSQLGQVPVLGPAIDWLQDTFGVSLAQLQAWAAQAAATALKWAVALGRAAVLGALGTVLGFAIMTFILFFAVRDGRGMFAALRALAPMPAHERERLFGHLASVARAVVYGSGVTALVQGVLVGIGFWLAGLPSPVVFGVLAALFALVPLAGTPVVWVPATIVLAMQDRWTAALLLLAWGAFVTTIDNFLRPMLVAGRAEVGTLTVFLGVLGGVAAFGAIGVVLGPLILAAAVALVRFALEARQAGVSTVRRLHEDRRQHGYDPRAQPLTPEREVTDGGQLKWSCVQAYGGSSETKRADAGADLATDDNGMVAVVCTPSAGAQSVRVELSRGWQADLADAELLAAIARARCVR